ncbi:intermediate cleaving peptidase 55, mitochondrial isoform X3 [Cryptomeria japonica]|uniref:intermediate cleaving peptidase 55, mitochondrial isoform X3 n=1 Tax=Cryptomeria japonica TaxID=3369 RepID=UPI0027DA2D5A|nr:intermediate cleaving peptidase 55, mitochondrial isoform X3 [Cryptomeria japonica]
MAITLRRDAIRVLMNKIKYYAAGEHFQSLGPVPHDTLSYSSNATQHIFDAGQPTAETHPQVVATGEITPGITEQQFIRRRKKLLELLPEKSLIIMPSAPVKMMTDVVPYPFRQDADYLYFTGCQQPGGIAVLNHELGLCMFMPDSKPEEEIWTGQVAGTYAALNTFKADQTFSISKVNEALLQTMLVSKAYPHEHILAATIEYECKIRGAQRMAFPPVVGGGVNGSVIHYSRNDQQIKEGEMVLMDVGCEIYGYVSDLTRTWPPHGSFSPAQQELYELILDTSNECLKLCKPGVSLHQIHTHSVQILSKGFKELGILKNTMNLSRSYRNFNPTSIGHYLGMDVHDCSSVSGDRLLQPGVVITIEPGVYIPRNSSVPERFRGIGIRIEDEVLITDSGHEVLTASVPKEIKHIQSLLH